MAAQSTLKTVLWRTAVVHTATYFVIGALSYVLFDYASSLSAPDQACFMRPASHPLVRAGVLFQPLRGLLFGLAFYPLRSVLFETTRGWAVTWMLLVFVGIFSTFAPASGSIEGFVYSTIPVGLGMIEVLVQSLALSVLLFAWMRAPQRRWSARLLVGVAAAGVLGAVLGMFVTSPA